MWKDNNYEIVELLSRRDGNFISGCLGKWLSGLVDVKIWHVISEKRGNIAQRSQWMNDMVNLQVDASVNS